jgi:hydroxymethylpyrimidine/phosphomethylpyrimidine kinase
VARNTLSREDVPAAAARLQELAWKAGNPELNVVVTGGHLHSPDDFLLTSNGKRIWLKGERVDTQSTHGTGCAFSAGLLCQLILGAEPEQAMSCTKEYVTAALKAAYPIGRGKGPMHHLFKRRSE